MKEIKKLSISDFKTKEDLKKEELEKLKIAYGSGIETDSICFSSRYIYYLTREWPYFGGNSRSLVYIRSETSSGKWDSPQDVHLYQDTKRILSLTSKINMKILAKYLLDTRINPFTEMNKILDIIKSNIDKFKDINLIIDDHCDNSYYICDYFVELYAIDYSTRNTNIIFKDSKYLDFVWKTVDGWKCEDILKIYNGTITKKAKISIEETKTRGECEIKEYIDHRVAENCI